MDKPTLRRIILDIVARRSPAPAHAAVVREGVLLAAGVTMTDKDVKAELLELCERGYLVNLKHALDPVCKGITGTARDQLDMIGKLDPALWGDAAL